MALENEINVATIFASAARTASANGPDLTNRFMKGAIIVIDTTVLTAGASIVYTVQGKDELSGKYYTILASAAVTATGTIELYIYPGATAAANLAANHYLPRVWRVIITAADTKSVTASVGAVLLP